MRAGLAVMMLAALALPWLARAQPEADAPAEIAVHPGVTTVVHLPDEIEHMRFTAPAAGMVRATNVANLIIMRPRRGLSAGTDIWLDVKTAAVHHRFHLRVVRRAKDADRKVLVVATEPVRDAEESARAAEQPAPQAPPAAPAAPERAEPARESAAGTARSPRFAPSVHAVVALPGFTALQIPGYQPDTAWLFHNALGLRLAVERPGTWWVLETNIGAEWPAGRLTYDSTPMEGLAVGGTWLHGELGMRVRLPTRWAPSLYAAIGWQAHLRRTVKTDPEGRLETSDTMNDGVALVLGTGLHRRVGDVLLGVDFQVRRGGPDEYLSVTALWSVGYVLDLGE